MRIPSSVSKNTLKAYCPSELIRKKHPPCNLEQWDEFIPKTLHELCVECIAKHWKDNPILDEIVLSIDRYLLLDILPSDLPLELTIPKIPDEIYWKKCYIKRWPSVLPNITDEVEVFEIVRTHDLSKLSSVFGSIEKLESVVPSRKSSRQFSIFSKASSGTKSEAYEQFSNYSKYDGGHTTWKECYIEMHLKQYFEKLNPEDYNPEKIKHLSDLCGQYVKSLNIDQMQCSRNSASKIPLNGILSGFRHLKELSLCFKQTYVKREFSWNILNTSSQDITLLAKGLLQLNLNTLRIRNSDIDCEKVTIILKALLKHELETIDFSHCKIGNKGFVAISKFVLLSSVKELVISNNRPSLEGYEALAYSICQSTCVIQRLNLRLNSVFDEAGNILLKVLKKHGKTLTSLVISGCGFSEELCIAEMLEVNNTLEFLDISNNNLGDNTAKKILQALVMNNSLKKLDVRMCKIDSNIELDIHCRVHKNTLLKNNENVEEVKEAAPELEHTWKQELISQIDHVFDLTN